jgi:hypothetical protein
MRSVWFKKVAWDIHPLSYLVTLLAILFMISASMAVVRNRHLVTGDQYEIFVFVTSSAFWWKWVAEKTS